MLFDKTVLLPVSPDVAFELLTQPERLRRWKTVVARVDLRIDGEYRFTVTPGHNAAGTITELEPGKRLVYTWGWEGDGDLPPGASTVSITLEQVDGGTTVRLVHEGLNEAQAAAHAAGWNHYLERLVELATSGDAGADEWAAASGTTDELTSAEATLAITLRVLRGLTPADREKPTPCADFDVHGLLEHLMGSITGIGAALGVSHEAALDVTAARDGSATPETRVADAAQSVLEAFRARGVEGDIDMGFAELPATTVASILNLEFLIHAWDFAIATGQSIAVPDSLADYVLGLARETITPQVRQRGSFGAETLVGEAASSLDRLIAFSGREVPING